MRKILGVVVVAVGLGLAYLYFVPFGAHADRGFDARVQPPAYASSHPVVLFDHGHYNAHTAGGKYAPFVKLMRNDGYEVRGHKGAFTPEALRSANVVVTVNAAGGSNPQLFGINMQPLRKGERSAPAFATAEIAILEAWVRDGGSLLLIADHYPFGEAAVALSPYAPSRMLTKYECGFALSAGRLVDPMYDLSFEDPERADPLVVLEFWEESGFLSTTEVNKLTSLFQENDVNEAAQAAQLVLAEPTSEAVGEGASVYLASQEYWLSVLPNVPGRDPDVIRRTLGDALGGIIGGILGGPIGSGLVGGGLSIAFYVESGCWPEPCENDNPPLPPAPCGGYTGIGPCP